jgi:predicted metal-binding membrane protein
MAHYQTAGVQRRLSVRSRSTVVVVALCLLAWLTLLGWQQSPYGASLSHQSLGVVQGGAIAALGVITGWLLMVIAMMLPTALPFLLAFQRANSHRDDLPWLSTLLIFGYLLSWFAFGVALTVSDWLLHRLLHTHAVLGGHAWMLGGLTLLATGVYQLTPLKRASLEACRGPQRCSMALDERAMGAARRALLVGLRHGRCCIGCCWALMLLMFATGTHSLEWMVGLSIVMIVEKWLPGGRRLALGLGVTLLIWGALLVLGGLAPAAHVHLH